MMDRELFRQALEALDTARPACFADNTLEAIDNAITALRSRLAQPEQEPVAWMYHGIRHDDTPHERPSLIWKPEYMDVMSAEKGAKATPLYTAPRQWQGLTADEIWACNVAPAGHSVTYHISMANQNVLDFAEAIEAKLRQKNA